MPPVGASFTLEEGGSLFLIACALSARVTGFRDVVSVEFRVADVIEDFDRLGLESSSSLLLDFEVGAGFGGPVNEVLANGSDVSVAFVSSCSGHV